MSSKLGKIADVPHRERWQKEQQAKEKNHQSFHYFMLKVPTETWRTFSQNVSHEHTLNEVLNSLIIGYLQQVPKK